MLKMILSKIMIFFWIAVGFSFCFWVFIWNYSFVFKSKVVGEIQAIESLHVQPLLVAGQNSINPQVFSISIAIKDLKSNEIHMASSEDRQWAAAQKGNCVVAAFFPYPPWNLNKGSTNHNARLLKNYLSCADVPKNDEGLWSSLQFFFLL